MCAHCSLVIIYADFTFLKVKTTLQEERKVLAVTVIIMARGPLAGEQANIQETIGRDQPNESSPYSVREITTVDTGIHHAVMDVALMVATCKNKMIIAIIIV